MQQRGHNSEAPTPPRPIPLMQTVGGSYESLNLSGIIEATSNLIITYVLTLKGALNGSTLTANGLSAVGTVALTEMKVRFVTLKGILTATHLSDGQNVNLEGNAQITELKSAALSLNGSLKSRTICVDCDIQAKGKIEANLITAHTLNMHGSIRVGTLEAENVQLILDKRQPSAINRLIGKTIVAKSEKKDARLESSYIEGKTIELQGTKVKLVCAENITIGSGCEVEEVRYSGAIKIETGAIVKKQTKI